MINTCFCFTGTTFEYHVVCRFFLPLVPSLVLRIAIDRFCGCTLISRIMPHYTVAVQHFTHSPAAKTNSKTNKRKCNAAKATTVCNFSTHPLLSTFDALFFILFSCKNTVALCRSVALSKFILIYNMQWKISNTNGNNTGSISHSVLYVKSICSGLHITTS